MLRLQQFMDADLGLRPPNSVPTRATCTVNDTFSHQLVVQASKEDGQL